MAVRLGAGGGGFGVGPFFLLGDFGATAPEPPAAPGAGAGAGDGGATAGSSLPPAPVAVHSVWKIGSRERALARPPESSEPLPLLQPSSLPPLRGGVHGGVSSIAAPAWMAWMAVAAAARGAPSGTGDDASAAGDCGDGGGLPGPAPPAASDGDKGGAGMNGARRGERGDEPGGTVTVSLAPPTPGGAAATGAAPR